MFKRKISKKIACPNCGYVIEKRGIPGEKSIIVCPKCFTKGYYIIPYEQMSKEQILQIIVPIFSIFIVLSIIHFLFKENELLSCVAILFLIPFFLFFNYEKKIIIGYTISLLFISMFSLSFYNDEILANQLIVYVYWLLVVDVLCQLIEPLRKLKLSTLKRIFG
jgi:hypothetical protein